MENFQSSNNDQFFDDSILFSNSSANKYNLDGNGVGYSSGNQLDFSKLLQSQTCPNQDNDCEYENNQDFFIYCSQGLKSFGYSELGKLQGSSVEISKTLKVVYELLQQRQRDLEYRNDVVEKTAKLESDKKSLRQSVERLKSELEAMKKENGLMQNSQLIADKKYKSEKEKLILEKEELSKQINKMNYRDTQVHVELRKKEAELNKLKEQLKKIIIEKSGNNKFNLEVINNLNSIQKIQKFQESQEYNEMIKKNFEQMREKLLSENQEMRNILINLQNDINAVVRENKEEFFKKKVEIIKKNSGDRQDLEMVKKYLGETDLISIKPEIFMMPYEKIGSELIQVFRDNFLRVRNFFSKIVNFDDKMFSRINNGSGQKSRGKPDSQTEGSILTTNNMNKSKSEKTIEDLKKIQQVLDQKQGETELNPSNLINRSESEVLKLPEKRRSKEFGANTLQPTIKLYGGKHAKPKQLNTPEEILSNLENKTADEISLELNNEGGTNFEFIKDEEISQDFKKWQACFSKK